MEKENKVSRIMYFNKVGEMALSLDRCCTRVLTVGRLE